MPDPLQPQQPQQPQGGTDFLSTVAPFLPLLLGGLAGINKQGWGGLPAGLALGGAMSLGAQGKGQLEAQRIQELQQQRAAQEQNLQSEAELHRAQTEEARQKTAYQKQLQGLMPSVAQPTATPTTPTEVASTGATSLPTAGAPTPTPQAQGGLRLTGLGPSGPTFSTTTPAEQRLQQQDAADKQFNNLVTRELSSLKYKNRQQAEIAVANQNPDLLSMLPSTTRERISRFQDKEPPAMTRELEDSILAKTATGLPFTQRELDAMGVEDPKDAEKFVKGIKQVRRNEAEETRKTMVAAALAGKPEEPLGKPVIDAQSGDPVNLTKREYAQNPKGYIVMTPTQEKVRNSLDTAKNHVLLTGEFLSALPTTGTRVSAALGAKLSQLQNNPAAVALFQQLHSMTSLALGGALVTAGGGRAGVRLAEFMSPAGVTEGDNLATAITKMNTWMTLVEKNAKDVGLPGAPYAAARNELQKDVRERLLDETNGDANKARAIAKQNGLPF